MKINYQKSSAGDYDWFVITSEGTVVSGTVVKGAAGWGSGGWVATITHVDGERHRTPEGVAGPYDTRADAVERVLYRYANES